MNDSWTKGIVDAGTTVLGIVNKLIDALSFGGKAKGIQSFLSLFMAFKGLKLAGRGANAGWYPCQEGRHCDDCDW